MGANLFEFGDCRFLCCDFVFLGASFLGPLAEMLLPSGERLFSVTRDFFSLGCVGPPVTKFDERMYFYCFVVTGCGGWIVGSWEWSGGEQMDRSGQVSVASAVAYACLTVRLQLSQDQMTFAHDQWLQSCVVGRHWTLGW